MAKYTRMRVIASLLETGLVPLFYNNDPETSIAIISACLEAGVRCVEFTNRGDFAHLVFEQVSRHFQKDEHLILGVGSIVDAGTASLYLQLGANFVVGPMLDADVARLCNRRKVAYLPGCQTVNEITAAHDLGVEIVKLFPGAQAGGPAFIKNVRGPLPYVRILPTGGVEPTEANLRGWFEAGAAAVGMGSNLIRSDWVAAGDYAAIRSAAAQSLEWIRTFRTRDPLD